MLDTPFNQLPRDGPFTKMSCLPLCLRDATKQGARCPPANLEGKQFETDVISRKLLEVLG